MLIKRGDVFYADLDPIIGSEQGGIRPVLVVQNNVGNKYSPTVVVLPISSAKKNNMRLVSVVLGGSTSDDRFASAMNMFEYGFANYKNKIVLDKSVTLNDEFFARGGKRDSFKVRPERDSYH